MNLPPRPEGQSPAAFFMKAVWDALWGNTSLFVDQENAPVRFTKRPDGKYEVVSKLAGPKTAPVPYLHIYRNGDYYFVHNAAAYENNLQNGWAGYGTYGPSMGYKWKIPADGATYVFVVVANVPYDEGTLYYDGNPAGIVLVNLTTSQCYLPGESFAESPDLVPITLPLSLIDDFFTQFSTTSFTIGSVTDGVITQNTEGEVVATGDWLRKNLRNAYYGTTEYVGALNVSGNLTIGVWPYQFGTLSDSDFLYYWMCLPQIPSYSGPANDFCYPNGALKKRISVAHYPPDPATPVPSSTNPWLLLAQVSLAQTTLAAGPFDGSKKFWRKE